MKLTGEETALLLTCRPFSSESEDATLRRLFAGSFNWNLFLWRAENSRTLSLAQYHVDRLGLADSVPRHVGEYLNRWRIVSDTRTRVMYMELGRILRKFSDEQIDLHLIKGAALGPLYYPSPQLRPMQDLDIMIHPEDAFRARSALQELGYSHGVWNPGNNSFTKMWPRIDGDYLSTHHELPSMTRCIETASLLADNQIPRSWRHKQIKCFVDSSGTMTVPVFIDLHVGLSAGIDLADVWHGTVFENYLGDHRVRVQSPSTMLWFLAGRLYHEAFEYGTIKLSMFGDIDAIIRSKSASLDWEHVLAVATKYSLQPALFYVLAQARAVLNTEVPERVIASLAPNPLDPPNTHDWGDVLPKLISRPELHRVEMA